MKKVIYAALAFSPVMALAQNLGPLTNILNFVQTVVRTLIPIAFGLAIVFFFYGLAQYIRSAGDPKKAAEGKSIMIYGTIAIAVMISIYGLAAWLQQLLGITPTATTTVPTVTGL